MNFCLFLLLTIFFIFTDSLLFFFFFSFFFSFFIFILIFFFIFFFDFWWDFWFHESHWINCIVFFCLELNTNRICIKKRLDKSKKALFFSQAYLVSGNDFFIWIFFLECIFFILYGHFKLTTVNFNLKIKFLNSVVLASNSFSFSQNYIVDDFITDWNWRIFISIKERWLCHLQSHHSDYIVASITE